MLLIGVGVLLGTPTSAAVDVVAISCPNKQTTFLTGLTAPPYESLIAYLNTRPVGGGLSDQDGAWRIPLHVNEHAGKYDVEVRVRSTRALVGRFTCYVDWPLDTTSAMPTETGTAGATAFSTATRSPVPTNRIGTTTATATRIPTTTGATPTRTPTSSSAAAATATRTPMTGATAIPTSTATATSTQTSNPATATAATATAAAAGIKINAAVCSDTDPLPTAPDAEYVELVNNSETSVTLTGWKIVKAQTTISYTFPTFTLTGPSKYVTIYSRSGTDQPEPVSGNSFFYWGRTNQIWFLGTTVELRDPSGKLIDSYTLVARDGC
ncbi:MAG: lamin tail domain-containing protein [Chloroflexales bacterium]